MMAETIDLARWRRRCGSRVRLQQYVAERVVNARWDPVLSADAANSDVAGIDGMGIVLAAQASSDCR